MDDGTQAVYHNDDRLVVHFGLALAAKHGKGVEGEGFHLVLAREAADRCKEANALTKTTDDVVGVSQSTSKQNGINLSAENSSLSSDILSHMVNHRVENKLGLLVAIFLYARKNFLDIIGTEMSVKTSFASNALQKLLLAVLATEAETDKVGGRQ